MSTIAPNVEVFTVRQADEWMATLERCSPYDFHHLPAYHALAEEQGEGAAHLFVYSEGSYQIALPLLLRDLDGLWPDSSLLRGCRDATSVYGYAGPVSSHAEIPFAVIQAFQAALRSWLRELHVINVFSRLHPLLPQRHLLGGLGDFDLRQTVSIDLTLSSQAQRSVIRRSFRVVINRLRRLGLICIEDAQGIYLQEFCHIYHETMRRVEAADHYFFPLSYFERLRDGLGQRFHLFVCLRDGKPVSAVIATSCCGILQYHLGGTLDEARELAPMKLLLDEVRLWGTQQELHVFHLGGGTTSRPDDPLLYFKQGFSDRLHEFATWRWIMDPETHQRLCEEKARCIERQEHQPGVPDFFPAYRTPCVPRSASVAGRIP